MKRVFLCSVTILAVAILTLGAVSGQAGAAGAHIHFCVVPTKAANGLNFIEAMEQFKTKLARLAGGYTELGLTNGGSISGGKLKKEFNFSFLVVAPRDISADLAQLIPQYFADPHPFILHWTGDRYTGAR